MPVPPRDAPSPRPWVTPPRLRTLEGTSERHTSWLELFFDMVFVVAIAQLAHELVVDHSLAGFARFGGLFLPVFIAWQGFMAYADRFDTDNVVFRVVMLLSIRPGGAASDRSLRGGGYSIGIALWLASLAVDEPARYIVWGVALVPGAFLLVSLVVAEITMQRAEAQAYPEGDS